MGDFLINILEEQNSLTHHGILGQKWGIRRFQNKDGSLTDEGRRRYLGEGTEAKQRFDKADSNRTIAGYHLNEAVDRYLEKVQDTEFKKLRSLPEFKNISDDDLFDYYLPDEAWDEKAAKKAVLESNKKLKNEVENAEREYREALKELYESIGEKTVNSIQIKGKNKHAKGIDRLETLLDADSMVKVNELNYGKDWRKNKEKYDIWG